MEPIQPDPRKITPGRAHNPVQRRAVFSDFTPRRAAPPQPTAAAQPRPAAPVSIHTSVPMAKPPHVEPPVQSRPVGESVQAKPAGPNRYVATPAVKPVADEHGRQSQAGDATPMAKPRSTSSHAGVVGAAVFIVLAALAVLPVLPGHAVALPGSSQSFSSGNNIPCITSVTGLRTDTVYTARNGFPIMYSYTTTETTHAACGSTQLSAVDGHTSGFNPLGGIIDLVAAAVVAIVSAKIWAFAAHRRT